MKIELYHVIWCGRQKKAIDKRRKQYYHSHIILTVGIQTPKIETKTIARCTYSDEMREH